MPRNALTGGRNTTGTDPHDPAWSDRVRAQTVAELTAIGEAARNPGDPLPVVDQASVTAAYKRLTELMAAPNHHTPEVPPKTQRTR